MEKQSTLQEIQNLYYEHILATEEFFASQSLGESIGRTFMGRGAYSGTGLFLPFLESLERIINAATAKPVSEEEAVAILRYMLVEEHTPLEHPSKMELETAEQKGDLLIPMLGKQAAGQLVKEYKARYKKQRMLPSQRKTLKTLEKASK